MSTLDRWSPFYCYREFSCKQTVKFGRDQLTIDVCLTEVSALRELAVIPMNMSLDFVNLRQATSLMLRVLFCLK